VFSERNDRIRAFYSDKRKHLSVADGYDFCIHNDEKGANMADTLRVAIILNPELPHGLLANTAGVIGIGLAAKFPMLAGHSLCDARGVSTDVISKYPLPILQATQDHIKALMFKALEAKGECSVVPFPVFARTMHTFEEYEQAFPLRDLYDEVLDGVGFVGPEKWIKSLTGNLKLFR
jgi:hypothetical protein